MTTPPKVQPVKIRLQGDDEAAAMVAELLTEHLPALSGGRCQAGELSRPYPNRRDAGVRFYLDLYVLPDPGTQ